MFTNLNRYLAFFVLTLTCLVGRAQAPLADTLQMPSGVPDSGALAVPDSSVSLPLYDSLVGLDSLTLIDSLSLLDSALVDDGISKNAITDPVLSDGEDSTVFLLQSGNQRTILYGNGKVTFQDMEITADYINFDHSVKVAFARGTYDSTTKTVKGKPVFKQGSETFEMDSMYFNFNTRKAKIYAVITQQSDGYLHGEVIKRMPDNLVYVAKGKYTTCDDEHPHWYMNLTKAKVVPGDKVITGPAYFVLEDVPTPL
ncbi:MAG: hypothetical protein LBJ57_05150, partial [Prevotellaceae bacterium]|nr:hypothetical protein [Prevotellaceae bacterium]